MPTMEDAALIRIYIAFCWVWDTDTETTRTQEFVLRWSQSIDRSFREIIRQQWNFSSPDSVREVENYSVELRDVAVLELVIEPDKGRVGARASILSLRVG